ncbi:hypothetical protein C8F01DRAFT_1113994 [Mycena amicta]|nr:hypothetical protein C8F01DRAFT_1113994 [Mycena amicta]
MALSDPCPEEIFPPPPPFFDSCPTEIIQLIICALPDPNSFSQTNKRIHAISHTNSVIAQYFVMRHGKVQALYHALGRGRLLSPSVLDILLASGAVMSRYLVQVAFHHYFFCSSHFIKPSTPWVRTVSLANFSHFLAVAAERLGGDIARGKGEDDGSLFAIFIKAKYDSQRVSWETIREAFEKYHFMPFCNRDPLMTQLPLALAIEPRLLPYAVANGFYMDAKYRDFVFRKMFERSSNPVPLHVEEICSNVRELCRLDTSMFVTRTVAAEVCMEAESNEAGYKALRQLDRSGDLPFSLTVLVQDVIKVFAKARAITTQSTCQILTKLYTDFLLPPRGKTATPSTLDPLVRRAMLLTIFAADPPVLVSAMAERLEPLQLGPLSLKDAEELLLSSFVIRYEPMFDYLRREGVASDVSGTRKVTSAVLRTLAETVAVRCLTRENKGKTLKRLYESYPSVKRRVKEAVLDDHQVQVEDLSEGEANVQCARLARSIWRPVSEGGDDSDSDSDSEQQDDDEMEEDFEMYDDDDDDSSKDGDRDSPTSSTSTSDPPRDLGDIGLEPLSVMLRRDEASQRHHGRQRRYFLYGSASVNNGSRHPPETLLVSKWIKTEFGSTSPVAAQFLTHAVVNRNPSVLGTYLTHVLSNAAVPITFKHFQILAKLGSSSNDIYLYDRIKEGATFYTTEQDYTVSVKLEKDTDVKMEPSEPRVKLESPTRGRARPRRSATSVNSYIVPDSDDEEIADEADLNDEFIEYRLGGVKRKKAIKVQEKPKPIESNLQMWIRALSELQKDEQRKYREKKKRVEQERTEGTVVGKIRVAKSEFLRSLTTNLRKLRELDEVQSRSRGEVTNSDADVMDSDGDEYMHNKPPRKKRKTTASA